MGTTFLLSTRNNFAAINGTTVYIPVGSLCAFANSTESHTQVVFRTAGKFRGLFVNNNTANSANGTSTVALRINGITVNNTVSIPASTSGEFEDKTSTDSVSAGDLVNYIATAGGSGNLNLTPISILFDASSGLTVHKLMVWGEDDIRTTTVVNVTRFLPASGSFGTGAGSTLNTSFAIPARLAMTVKNFFVNIQSIVTSPAANSATVGFYKNTATTNLSVSILDGTSGIFEDTTHEVKITPGDTYQTFFTTPNITSITITWNGFGAEYITKDRFEVYAASTGGTTMASAASPDRYNSGLAGLIDTNSSTQNRHRVRIGIDTVVSLMTLLLLSNTADGTHTHFLQKNNVDSALGISIPAGTSGTFSNLADKVSVVPSDVLEIHTTFGTSTSGVAAMRARTLVFGTLKQIRNISPKIHLGLNKGKAFSLPIGAIESTLKTAKSF